MYNVQCTHFWLSLSVYIRIRQRSNFIYAKLELKVSIRVDPEGRWCFPVNAWESSRNVDPVHENFPAGGA